VFSFGSTKLRLDFAHVIGAGLTKRRPHQFGNHFS
jgi:hypothetical protein